MTEHFVDSNASGANDGTSWTDAATDSNTMINTIGVADGDIVSFASDHAESFSSTRTLSFPAGHIKCRSVNKSTGAYEAGASLDGTSAADLSLEGGSDNNSIIEYAGINFTPDDDLFIRGTGSRHIFRDCAEWGNGVTSGSSVAVDRDGIYVELVNCGIQLGFSNRFIQVGFGAAMKMIECYAGANHVKVTDLFSVTGNGSFDFEAINTDLDAIIATSGSLISDHSASGDFVHFRLKRCKLPTSFGAIGAATPANNNYIIDISECDQGDGYYYTYYEEGGRGVAETDLSQYVDDGSVTYDGTNEFSIQIDTGDEVSSLSPFRYRLKTFPGVNLTTAQTVELQLTCSNTLTDNDVWVEIEVQDTTDQALGVIQSTQNADPLAAGSNLSTSGVATWATTTDTEQVISKDLGAQTGLTNSNVTVYVCVGKASETLNVSMPTIAAT